MLLGVRRIASSVGSDNNSMPESQSVVQPPVLASSQPPVSAFAPAANSWQTSDGDGALASPTQSSRSRISSLIAARQDSIDSRSPSQAPTPTHADRHV